MQEICFCMQKLHIYCIKSDYFTAVHYDLKD